MHTLRDLIERRAVAEDMTQGHGYRVVLRPELMVAEYEEYAQTQRWFESLRELRLAFGRFDPAKYRGMSRNPLAPDPSLDRRINDAIMESDRATPSNVAAGRRYREMLGEPADDLDYDPGFDETLLSSVDDAREIVSLTDDPSRWEIIRIAKTPAVDTEATLGYDVGCWGGFFSTIADVCVVPRWHPPIPEDFESVAEALSPLNSHMLFDSAEEAKAYLQFYTSKAWAESGEFFVVQVGSVT